MGHHGRRQGRTPVLLRPRRCLRRLRQEHRWWRGSAMLDEVDGPMNFTQMVTLFASKMAGKIDADAFRHSLMTFGVKFSASEVDDAFAEMKIDEGMIDAAHLKGLMVSK